MRVPAVACQCDLPWPEGDCPWMPAPSLTCVYVVMRMCVYVCAYLRSQSGQPYQAQKGGIWQNS